MTTLLTSSGRLLVTADGKPVRGKPPGAVLSDDFAAADGTNIAGRSTPTGEGVWSVTSGEFQIQSGRAVLSSGGTFPGSAMIVDTGQTDGVVEAVVNLNGATGSTAYVEVIFRVVDQDNWWGVRLSAADGFFRFVSRIGGANSSAAGWEVPDFDNTADYTVRIEYQGGDVKVFLDGKQRLSRANVGFEGGGTGVGVLARVAGTNCDELSVLAWSEAITNPSNQPSLSSTDPLLALAAEPLAVETYVPDGIGFPNETLHPAVIDFQTEHGMASWAGYRYWMVSTPWPGGLDFYENPELHASHDGVTWVVPDGITNPLVAVTDTTGGNQAEFHSDPELVYDPAADELRVYYRYIRDGSGEGSRVYQIRLLRIPDTLTFDPPVAVIDIADWAATDITTRSLCVWREDAENWHMWGGGSPSGSTARPYMTFYHHSTDGLSWSAPQQVHNARGLDPFLELGYENWHMAGKPNLAEGRMEFIAYCWQLGSQNGPNAILMYAEVPLANPTAASDARVLRPVLRADTGGWPSFCLYRCSFVIGAEGHYDIWYSGYENSTGWRIAFTSGVLPT